MFYLSWKANKWIYNLHALADLTKALYNNWVFKSTLVLTIISFLLYTIAEEVAMETMEMANGYLVCYKVSLVLEPLDIPIFFRQLGCAITSSRRSWHGSMPARSVGFEVDSGKMETWPQSTPWRSKSSFTVSQIAILALQCHVTYFPQVVYNFEG